MRGPCSGSGDRFVLGIDQGTTGTRAGVMDTEGRFVSWAYRTHRQIHPAPGWVEHDPVEILENTRGVVREALAAAGDPAIGGIGLSNQGETVVLRDRSSGEPLYNALVWQDVRTQEWMERLGADPEAVSTIDRKTGLKPDAYFSASKIAWILENVPRARELLAENRLAAGTLDTWLMWWLSGRETFVTDPSTAARTLLFDIHRSQWDEELLGIFGVPRGILAEVRPSTGCLARTREVEGLPEGVPFAASLVDQPAAMAGHGCLVPGGTKATYGTGCFVYMNTGRVAPRPGSGLLGTVAWQRGEETTYALDGGVFTVGSAIEWLRDTRLIEDPRQIDEMLGAGARRDRTLFVPALAGLGAPVWDRGAAGAFLGMRLSTTREDMVRAVLEGIAARVVQVVRAMEASSGRTVPRLRVDGGLTQCRVLMQIQADLLGVPVEVSAEAEGATAGVCYLAAREIGLWGDDREIDRRVAVGVAYHPSVEPEERAARMSRFDQAMRLVRELPE